MAQSRSRRQATVAVTCAADGEQKLADRRISAQLAVALAMLELAFQIGRLADQVPVYGPPEES